MGFCKRSISLSDGAIGPPLFGASGNRATIDRAGKAVGQENLIELSYDNRFREHRHGSGFRVAAPDRNIAAVRPFIPGSAGGDRRVDFSGRRRIRVLRPGRARKMARGRGAAKRPS